MSGKLSSTANCQFSRDRDMSRTGTAGPPGLAMDWDFGALSACPNTDILEETIRRMAWTTFHELRLENEFCDVTIKVDDVEFKAHKIILSVGSLYFSLLGRVILGIIQPRRLTSSGLQEVLQRLAE